MEKRNFLTAEEVTKRYRGEISVGASARYTIFAPWPPQRDCRSRLREFIKGGEIETVKVGLDDACPVGEPEQRFLFSADGLTKGHCEPRKPCLTPGVDRAENYVAEQRERRVASRPHRGTAGKEVADVDVDRN